MSIKQIYLITYNLFSFIIWSLITVRTVYLLTELAPRGRVFEIYEDILWPYLVFVQGFAALDVFHAATGLVRAPLGPTALQISGKNAVVWLVMVKFPQIILKSEPSWFDGKSLYITQGQYGQWPFVGCVISWGLSEMIRYGYFAANLIFGYPPAFLKWLRYNAFVLLYPLGFFSEASLVYMVIKPAGEISSVYKCFFIFCISLYIPASFVLITHMLKQRRRNLKTNGSKKGLAKARQE